MNPVEGLVSIITPTYNCGPFIAETVGCVRSQTYPNWEMLIIDDFLTATTFGNRINLKSRFGL